MARRKGIDVYSISKILGHGDISMTQNYLAKLDYEMQDTAMRKMFNKGNEEAAARSLIEGLSQETKEQLLRELLKERQDL